MCYVRWHARKTRTVALALHWRDDNLSPRATRQKRRAAAWRIVARAWRTLVWRSPGAPRAPPACGRRLPPSAREYFTFACARISLLAVVTCTPRATPHTHILRTMLRRTCTTHAFCGSYCVAQRRRRRKLSLTRSLYEERHVLRCPFSFVISVGIHFYTWWAGLGGASLSLLYHSLVLQTSLFLLFLLHLFTLALFLPLLHFSTALALFSYRLALCYNFPAISLYSD